MSENKYNDIGERINAVRDNLSRIYKHTSEMRFVRMAHIKELAYELCSSYRQTDITLDFDISWIEQIRNVCAELDLDTVDMVELSREIALLSQRNGSGVLRFFTEYNESVPAAASDKIASVKNFYTENAYLKFSRYLQKPSAIYLDSFTSACEDVASMRYEYAIVPIENSDDGKLMGFYRLLDMNGLKIALTSSVTSPDERGSTTLALVKRGIDDLNKRGISEGAKYFELCLTSKNGAESADICLAARLLGMKLHRIDSAALAYRENEFEYYIIIDTASHDIYPFMIYLNLIGADYSPVGFYTHIK